MSLINRMLSDLDRRGERPGSTTDAQPAEPAPRPRRRGFPLRALGPALLAVALVAVAAALVYQRADQLVAGLGALTGPASGSGQADNAQAQAAPRITDLRFETTKAGVELSLTVDQPLGGPPGYSRDGDRVELHLPASGANQLALPAPPAGQDIVRRLRVTAGGDPAVLDLSIDPNARVALSHEGAGVTLRALAAQGERAGGADGDDPAPQAADDDAGSREGGAADSTDATQVAQSDEPNDAADAEQTADTATQAASATETEPSASNGAGRDAPEPEQASASDASADSSEVAADAGEPAETTNTTEGAAGEEEAIRQANDGGPALRAKRRYRRAREALDAGDLTRARALLEQALGADPGLHPARELLVALLRRARDTAAARDVLAKGLERAPQRVAYAKPMARLLADAGELERAAAVLERARATAGGDPTFHALRGAIAQRLGRHEEAITAYTRALEGDTGRGQWWLGLAISLAAADHSQQARSAFREARASGDLSPEADRWARQRIEALARSGGD